MSLFKNTKFIFSMMAIALTGIAIYFTAFANNQEVAELTPDVAATSVNDADAQLPAASVITVTGAAAGSTVSAATADMESASALPSDRKQMLIMVRHVNRADVPCTVVDGSGTVPAAPQPENQ
jgi:hypothetical protein